MQPPPPPPLPGSGFADGAEMPTQSELAKRMAEAQDTHSLAAHRIVERLRATLTSVAHLAEGAKHDLSDTVGARTIIIHGPTGTGKSTVVPWEAMRWLEDHCADRATTPGIVLCSQQRRKVTISLAEEVRIPEETWRSRPCGGRLPCVQEQKRRTGISSDVCH